MPDPQHREEMTAQTLAQEYQEVLRLPAPRETVNLTVGLKELVVGLLALGGGALLLATLFLAAKNHFEKQKYGFYLEKGSLILNRLAEFLSRNGQGAL